MRGRSPVTLCGVLLMLAGCVGWYGQTGKDAIAPGLRVGDPPPSPRARLLGRLWPPADQPAYVIGRREISITREDERVGEAQTDWRGTFEAWLPKTGSYALAFSADGCRASAVVTVDDLQATYRVDLVMGRDRPAE